jgi:hypothetical protein
MILDLAVGARESETVADREMRIPKGSPLFFVSYASTAKTSQYVGSFFRELSDHVCELVGRSPGDDSGFLAQRLPGGREWAPELIHAVNTCQVFVPLISSSLINSDWCGREWDAFARRLVTKRLTGRPDQETAIVPVTWSRTVAEHEPNVVQKIQRFEPPLDEGDPTLSQRYRDNGVYGFRAMGRDNDWQVVIWRLAERIADVYWHYKVEPGNVNDPDELTNVFES